MGRKVQVNIKVDEDLLDDYDRYVEEDSYHDNRSAALRYAMREQIQKGAVSA